MDLNENVLDALEELKNFTFRKLYHVLDSKSEEEFREWFVKLGLLHEHRKCPGSTKHPECREDMTLKQGDKGWTWRCKKWNCRKEVAYKSGTFFESSHLTFKEVLLKILRLKKFILDFRAVLLLGMQSRNTRKCSFPNSARKWIKNWPTCSVGLV